jgi:diguanylate cyclase (GGDEF)-like protein
LGIPPQKQTTQRRTPVKLRGINLFGLGLGLLLVVGLVFVLDSGPLVDWVFRNRHSKLDEVLIVALLFLVAITFFSLRGVLGLPNQAEHIPETDPVELDARLVKERLWRDLVILTLLLITAGILVFLFDSGSLIAWLADHKGTKIDEIIVASVVLLIGLSFFSVRRSVELRQHLEAYETLHQQSARLHRESTILSELNDLLQSCLTAGEAYPIVASRAQLLLPGLSGAISIIANSRNLVETLSNWGTSFSKEQVFAPQDCWALRRGRPHISRADDTELGCPHLAHSALQVTLCMPMMAHGETLGLLCIGSNLSADRSKEFPEIQLIRALAENSSLALANLKLREVLRNQSVRDPLTNLYNRRYMEEFLDGQLSRAVRKKSSLALMMLDVDHFKKFNDNFGHDAGDMVLRTLGNLFLANLRKEDVICRFGGEEFAIILPDASTESARSRAEQLRAVVRETTLAFHEQLLPPVSISVGLAMFPDDGMTREILLKSADAALYRAKNNGRDCVVIS